MEGKKRLGINLFAQLFAFAVGFIINFFLAPFVINRLGTEAYGFIGLANNFVSYTTLITIALNSMAARFISISFHKGDIISAKKYFSSVYYANLFLAIIIALFAIFIVLFLDSLISIPSGLTYDVKLLFGLTFLNSIIALTSNIYLVATFIKNRLDLSSFRNIISNLLRVLCIVIPFLLFQPHLWYYGISALAATIFVAITNRMLTNKLLPDFKVETKFYDFKLVKELMFSGGWNLLTRLSQILSTGLDLLIANLFISSMAMGMLSISKAVPIIILSLCSSVAAVFAPKLTELYAKGSIAVLRDELFNNIKIMSVLAVLPLVTFLVLGEDFFRLWIPSEDSHMLYLLSIVAISSLLVSMPQESLWNIFTITNKIKISSYYLLLFNVLILSTTITCFYFFDNEFQRLLSIVLARCFWEAICSLTFLPIYGAKCLGLKWHTFYPVIFKNILLAAIVIVFFTLLKGYFIVDSWWHLTLFSTLICIVTLSIMSFFVLNKQQKMKILNFIQKHIK